MEVPFGRMRKEGVVLSLTQETDVPPEKLRDILRPLEDYAAICPTLLTLAQQMEWIEPILEEKIRGI